MSFQPPSNAFASPQDLYETGRVLQKTLAILSEPGSWTVGAYARDHNHASVTSRNNDWLRAHSFCYKGAIFAAAHAVGLGPEPSYAASMDQYHAGAVSALFEALPPADQTGKDRAQALIVYNDTPDRTHSEIVACLKAAISTVETQLQTMAVPV